MNIILIGMKACGKSTVGQLLAKKLRRDFVELDSEIEKNHWQEKKEKLTFREIFKKYGGEYFRSLEKNALKMIIEKNKNKQIVLACGGGTPLDPENQELLKQLGKIFFLDVGEEILLPRILKHGIPAFFPYQDDPKKSLKELLEKRRPIYKKVADEIISFKSELPEILVNKIFTLIN